MAQNYDVGTRAWQPDATEGWIASEVVSKTIVGSKAKLVFKLENGEVHIARNNLTFGLRLTSPIVKDG
jgi:myosin heavy subunit